jgi:hypothetical protein
VKFTIGQLLSVGTGRLCCDVGQVYEICNALTGDILFTHQLPRACRVLGPWVHKQFPWLAAVDASHVNTENVHAFVEELAVKHGREFEIAPLPVEVWEHQDPIAELAKLIGTERMIVVQA